MTFNIINEHGINKKMLTIKIFIYATHYVLYTHVWNFVNYKRTLYDFFIIKVMVFKSLQIVEIPVKYL